MWLYKEWNLFRMSLGSGRGRIVIIINITIYFKNVHFFHGQLGSDVFPDMRLLHISLNTTHSECKPSSSISSLTHSLKVFLPLPAHLTPATTTSLQADTQLSPLLSSTCPNHLTLINSQPDWLFWLSVRNTTSLRSGSRCFVSPPDSSYDCPVTRPFPLRCAINFTGWASNQEWSLSWLSWLTRRFTVWLRSTCLPTVFQCCACQVAHIFDLLISGPCSSPELRLRQSALRVFTVRALAFGTPCLRLFVTSICHWRLSGVN